MTRDFAAIRKAVVREYINGKRLPELHRLYRVGTTSISRWLQQAGVPTRPPGEGRRQYTLNDHAFDAETEQAKYWIGFLMADGCISDTRSGSNTIQLTLSLKDMAHIESFRDFLGSNHRIYIRKDCSKAFPNSRPVATLTVRSSHLADRLASYGVVPRKSKTARVIGLEMDRDFWRGTVDGDGYVIKNDKGYPEIGLCGSYELVSQFREFFLAICPESRSIVRPMHGIFKLVTAANKARRLIRALYGGCTVALPRKWDVAKEVIRKMDEQGTLF